MIAKMTKQEAQAVVGGFWRGDFMGPQTYKCWAKNGREYWTNQATGAGCLNSKTGQMEYGRGKQPNK